MGGDEFAVLRFPETDADDATVALERLRHLVAPQQTLGVQEDPLQAPWRRILFGLCGVLRYLSSDEWTPPRLGQRYARGPLPRTSGGVACRKTKSASIAAIGPSPQRCTRWYATTSRLSSVRSTMGALRCGSRNTRDRSFLPTSIAGFCAWLRPAEMPRVQRDSARGFQL